MFSNNPFSSVPFGTFSLGRILSGEGQAVGAASATSSSFLSFRFDPALHSRDRVVSVSQEPAREVAVSEPSDRVIYILQDAQRTAFVRKEKVRVISVAQPQKRLAKVA